MNEPSEKKSSHDIVNLPLDRQVAIAILHVLEETADDVEDSYYLARERKDPELESFKGHMDVTRQRFTAFRRAYQVHAT